MDAIVSALLTNMMDRLLTTNISLARGLHTDISNLQNTLTIISAFILDAKNKQTQNQSILLWLQNLKDALFDAQDILDEIECEALRNQVVKTRGGFTTKVHRFLSPSSNPLAFRVKIAHKIKDIKERIDDIASLGMKLGLSENHNTSGIGSTTSIRRSTQKMTWRETHSYVRPSHVIGRDEEKEKIIGFLMDPTLQSDHDEIDVIPIVGIGGLGKTTLAQLVYNDDRIDKHFDLRMWVFVSDVFDVKKIVLEILKAMSGMDIDLSIFSFDRLQDLLRETLWGKKFLLVLDDVWNEDYREWLELKNLLLGMHDEDDKLGSKIITTTRSDKVASIMGNVYKHSLEYLPEEDCLKLFVKCALPPGEGTQHPRLLEIGKDINRKCKGLPLAVVSLGCLLYSKPDESEWKKIRDSEIWKMNTQNDDAILAALKLSYNQLSSELKQCFSYCSIFPKGYEYTNLTLISFWMAHGLLQTKNEDEEPEDLGEFYIQELVSRSFFEGAPEEQLIIDGLVFEELEHLGISFFKMPDLVHDLAVSTMQSERAIVKFNSTHVKEKVQHLSFSDCDEGVPTFGKMSSKVRTIGFWHAGQNAHAITEPFFKWISDKFKYLRVLNLQGSNFKFLPDCFDKMKHLRYLDLSYCQRLEKLPDSICKLQSLEVLNLSRCVALKHIPKNLRNLVSLRILWITTQVTDLSSIGIGNLKYLQILILWKCDNLMFLPRDLRHLTALKRLTIEFCERVVSFEDNGEENENYPMKLERFSIDKLPKLKALPSWLKRSDKTLRYMGLSECPSLMTLPEWLPNLTSLETLLIADCPNLILPQHMDRLQNLQNLKIYGSPQQIERYIQNTGSDWSKIAHIPNVELVSV